MTVAVACGVVLGLMAYRAIEEVRTEALAVRLVTYAGFGLAAWILSR